MIKRSGINRNMTDRKENHRVPICPSCGEPVSYGFLHLKIGDKVKTVFVLLLIGYVILSIFLLVMSVPPDLRRGCTTYDPRWQLPNTAPPADRCQDNEFTLWLKSLNMEPAFQVFVGGGIATGVLIFYWDWLQNNNRNWQSKRERPNQESGKKYTHECRHCGRQWN
jgi:hypothetical protein